MYGKNLDEVEKLGYEYDENRKVSDKKGKEKKLRCDGNILVGGVVCLNRENEEIWDEYKKDGMGFVWNKYGKKLVCVIEDSEEGNGEFEFYVIEEGGKGFDLIDDGKKGLFEKREKKKEDENIGYLNGMRKVEEDFFGVVCCKYGLWKDGGKRKRRRGKDYFKEKREIKVIEEVKEEGKIDGYNFGVDDFDGKRWLKKVVSCFSVKKRRLEEGMGRGDRYKKGVWRRKKKVKNRESDLEEREKEVCWVKDKFKERVNNERWLVKDKNNKVSVENENIKKENEELEDENKKVKRILEECVGV